MAEVVELIGGARASAALAALGGRAGHRFLEVVVVQVLVFLLHAKNGKQFQNVHFELLFADLVVLVVEVVERVVLEARGLRHIQQLKFLILVFLLRLLLVNRVREVQRTLQKILALLAVRAHVAEHFRIVLRLLVHLLPNGVHAIRMRGEKP